MKYFYRKIGKRTPILMQNQLIVVYKEPNGIIHPISIGYGVFHFGVDRIAIFTQDSQIKKAIKSIKLSNNVGGKISANGKYIISKLNKNSLNIKIENDGSIIIHSHGGIIKRANIVEINSMPIKDWIRHLKRNNQLKIL